MPRFTDVDLGTDASLRRMVRMAAIRENELIEECAVAVESVSAEAASIIRKLKREEGL